MWIYRILFIHALADGLSHFLAVGGIAAVNICVLFENLFSVPLGLYLGVELLGLTLICTSRHFIFPRFHFLHIFANTCYFLFCLNTSGCGVVS